MVAGAAVALPATTLAAIGAEPDPIFGMIERHRAALAAHVLACAPAEIDGDEPAYQAGGGHVDMLLELLRTRPTTVAGGSYRRDALLQHYCGGPRVWRG